MGFALAIKIDWVTIECCSCGTVFAVSVDLDRNWHKTKQQFYCPNGHSQSYTKSTAEKLSRELEEKNRSLAWERERVASLQKQVHRQEQTTKRLQRRIKAGVCPCCHRTVSQLARHMAQQHPQYARNS